MFDTIAPNYDKVNRIMTGRLDVSAGAARPSALQGAPVIIADLAAGTGDLVYELQDHGMSAIGVDPVDGHRTRAAPCSTFPACRASLSLRAPDGSLDGVTCGFALRNFESLLPVFAELAPRCCAPADASGCSRSANLNPVLQPSSTCTGKVVPKIQRPVLRCARLPLPAPLGRLSAATDRDPSPDRRCRLRPVPSSPADRWPRPAVHGHAATG